jgi:RNA polymerase sigma factor (sigma-70 family)
MKLDMEWLWKNSRNSIRGRIVQTAQKLKERLVEDEVQELIATAFAKGMENQEQYDPKAGVKPVTWLGAVAENATRDHLRARRAARRREDEAPAEYDPDDDSWIEYYDSMMNSKGFYPSPEDELIAMETVESRADELTEYQEIIGRLLHEEGLTPRQVAEALDISRGAVDLVQHKIRQKLSGK